MATARQFRSMKKTGERIAALTAYDASFARLVHEADVDTVLVGDSLGMVIHGEDRTHGVTVADITYHTRCVRRGAPELHIIGDLPFGSYEIGPEQAFAASTQLIAAGAHMVKLEGGANVAPTVAYLVARGIPVCGHIGLMPQAALATGYAVQGKSKSAVQRILADAQALDAAGATLLVLECIPATLAKQVTAACQAATIGIGAGRDCDGQILVLHDMLGVFPKPPSFSHNFMPEGKSVAGALQAYVKAVKQGKFPQDRHIPA